MRIPAVLFPMDTQGIARNCAYYHYQVEKNRNIYILGRINRFNNKSFKRKNGKT